MAQTAQAQSTPIDITHADAGVIHLYLPSVPGAPHDLAQDLQQALIEQGVNAINVNDASFWHPYQQGLRLGREGVYFAQHHFASWAVTRHNFEPIFTLHGQLKYVVAAHRADGTLFEVRDLSGKTICREPGLHLGTVWLNDVLGAQRINANSQEVASVERAMQGAAKAKNDVEIRCDVYVLEDHRYNRVNKQSRGKFIRLAQSPIYQHNTFVAHPQTPISLKNKLVTALKNHSVQKVLSPYFQQMSQWQTLRPSDMSDYQIEDTELLTPYWGENK